MTLNAMIFAAGIGSRLRPITDTIPKALVKVGGYTLLEIALRKMKGLGVSRVVINVHHFADQIKRFLYDYYTPNMEIILSDESKELLDTGGGLLNAISYFDYGADILVYNVDIVCNAPISKLIEQHHKDNNLASLMVQKRKASRYLLFDKQMQLQAWHNPSTGEEIWHGDKNTEVSSLGFGGVQLLRYDFMRLINNSKTSFPIIPEYLKLAKDYPVKGWLTDANTQWFDIGTPEKLKKAQLFFENGSHSIESFF